jgi:hypothetical protein
VAPFAGIIQDSLLVSTERETGKVDKKMSLAQFQKAIAPGYVGTPMVKNMNQRALEKILDQVPIGRLVEPEEVASLVGELFRNEALNGETFFIHGGLRLGSKG